MFRVVIDLNSSKTVSKGFHYALGVFLVEVFLGFSSKSYETFLIASFMTSSDAPPLYKP